MKIVEAHLVQLAAVIETGGVTEAAAMLGMTQSAVSRTLSILEKRIGEPLFVSGRRPMQPTPLGEQLGQQGKAILASSRKAMEIVRSFKSGSSGRVRIGGVPFFMDAVVSPMIASFQRGEPGIMVYQSYGNYPDLVAELDSGQIDLAVTPTGSVDLRADLHFEPILTARNVLTCGAGHPLVRKRTLATEDIVNYPWIAPLPGSPLVLDLHNILLTLGLAEVSLRYAGGSLLSVVNYLAGTDALAILPHSVVHAFRGENKISIIPLDIPQPERVLGVMTRKKPYSNPAGRKFLGHMRREFAELRRAVEKHEKTIQWVQGPFMGERERIHSGE
ncbi:LysR family transcriptional regulator [Shinella sp. H4-D48]|uniref:LysR family transcriptional regulator n=1 Tax=Shinella sedimenti TaxID=2919913 RepID=A0ABT0CM04_9HYPH|nr:MULTISPECIES: LysR family transcriptional regulator [Shinella]MCJ8149637.1 LysR family transcriptional regulator [Shinella sedimenti]UNK38264.1 LysR family transcriptional regulator [Shinella sp. H4-D48]